MPDTSRGPYGLLLRSGTESDSQIPEEPRLPPKSKKMKCVWLFNEPIRLRRLASTFLPAVTLRFLAGRVFVRVSTALAAESRLSNCTTAASTPRLRRVRRVARPLMDGRSCAPSARAGSGENARPGSAVIRCAAGLLRRSTPNRCAYGSCGPRSRGIGRPSPTVAHGGTKPWCPPCLGAVATAHFVLRGTSASVGRESVGGGSGNGARRRQGVAGSSLGDAFQLTYARPASKVRQPRSTVRWRRDERTR